MLKLQHKSHRLGIAGLFSSRKRATNLGQIIKIVEYMIKKGADGNRVGFSFDGGYPLDTNVVQIKFISKEKWFAINR